MWSKHHSVKLDGSSDMDRLPPARHTINTLCTQPQGFDTLPVTTLIFKPFGLPPAFTICLKLQTPSAPASG